VPNRQYSKHAKQCWCGVVHLAKKWTARIFYQNATAKKYRTFFRLFDRNIATDTAKLSIENHVFQALHSDALAGINSNPKMIKNVQKSPKIGFFRPKNCILTAKIQFA
jgi:hypothetical protein